MTKKHFNTSNFSRICKKKNTNSLYTSQTACEQTTALLRLHCKMKKTDTTAVNVLQKTKQSQYKTCLAIDVAVTSIWPQAKMESSWLLYFHTLILARLVQNLTFIASNSSELGFFFFFLTNIIGWNVNITVKHITDTRSFL